jgi:ABC-type microcin C transport system permease subunit YejB
VNLNKSDFDVYNSEHVRAAKAVGGLVFAVLLVLACGLMTIFLCFLG